MVDWCTLYWDDDTGGGTGESPAGDWYSSMPQELRENATMQRFKDGGVEHLAKSFLSAQSTNIGTDKISVPGDNATTEELTAFYEKLGCPADVKDYNFERGENIPEEYYSKDMEEWFGGAAKEEGLSTKQATGILSKFNEYSLKQMTEQREAAQLGQDKAKKDLATEWGSKFESNINMAKRVIDQIGGSPLREFLDQSQFGDAPLIIRAFSEVGRMIAEDDLAGFHATNFGANTPGQAKDKISAKRADEKFMVAFNDASHIDHSAAVSTMDDLYKQAFPPT